MKNTIIKGKNVEYTDIKYKIVGSTKPQIRDIKYKIVGSPKPVKCDLSKATPIITPKSKVKRFTLGGWKEVKAY